MKNLYVRLTTLRGDTIDLDLDVSKLAAHGLSCILSDQLDYLVRRCGGTSEGAVATLSQSATIRTDGGRFDLADIMDALSEIDL